MPIQLLIIAVVGFFALVGLLTRDDGKPKKIVKRKRASGAHNRSGERADLVSALRNLGYTKKEAEARAARARGSSFDDLMRSALRK